MLGVIFLWLVVNLKQWPFNYIVNLWQCNDILASVYVIGWNNNRMLEFPSHRLSGRRARIHMKERLHAQKEVLSLKLCVQRTPKKYEEISKPYFLSCILRRPLMFDEISKFHFKLLSSFKKKFGDFVIFLWPSQNIRTLWFDFPRQHPK